MCGFFGQYNTSNLPSTGFKSLLAMSTHRGPDQTGVWEGERVQLGFNRLAILDLTQAGHQPMQSPTGQFVVVFNGEIYNHQHLRKTLPAHNYRGHSDTETITCALEVWGIRKTVEALDGMFALAIYDTHNNELVLARDFAGIKPLFYGDKKGQIVFGSQYDQVRAHPLFRDSSVNPQVLKLYLTQHFMPAPFGLHKDLHQLHPGEIISFKPNGDLQKERYWEMPTALASDLITDSQEAQAHFTEAFAGSVANQLVADVPLGAFLSGGVDSPLVCAYAKEQKANLEVFSIGSDSKKHDESDRAKQFAEALELNQHLWKLDAEQMVGFWQEATTALHEPLADFSILPTFLVSKLAKKHVTVSLSGDGGDELFMGYERFWSVGTNRTFHAYPNYLRKLIYGADKVLFKNKHVNSLLTVGSQAKAHESLHSRFPTAWLNKIAPDLQQVELPEEWNVYNYPNTTNLRQLMANMRKAEFYGMMQKTLRKVDLASMQNSLEVRVPFLQKKTIEAALQIDPLLSVTGGERKKVLKSNLASCIPQVQDDGVKRGFSIPLGDWIRGDLKAVFENQFSALTNQQAYIDKNAAMSLLNSHLKGQDAKWPLFTLFALNP